MKNSWPTVSLADHVDLVSGFPFKSSEFTDVATDTPLIKGENVGQGKILWEISKRWPSAEFSKYAKFRLQAGDVVLAMDRPWVPAGLKWAYISNGDPDALLVQRVCRLRSNNPDSFDQGFLRCLIGSSIFERYIKPITTGVNVPHISGQQILDYKFSLPPLRSQKIIATILSAYDDLIENNTRRIAILEEMARLIYREWFVNFRFPSHENVKFVDSELGKIPEGWEVKNFPDFVDVLSGGTPKTEEPLFWNGDIPFFTPRDAPESVYVLSTLKNVTQLGVTRCNSKLYPPDTLFITARGTVGKLALAGSEMIMSQSCYALRGKAGIGQSFLYLLTGTCIDQLQKSAHGSVFDTIIVDTFNLLRSALPPISLIAQFEEVASPLFELIKTLLRSNVNLRKTRDLLLPRLISGEIDVSDLNIETPMETEHQTIDLPKQGTATTPVMQPGMVEQKVQEMEERAEAFIIAPAAGPVEEGAVLIHSEVEESAAAETKGRTSTNSTIPIEEIETNTVMAAMRSVAKQTGPTTRDEFLRATCRELGYGRIGSKIEEALRGHLRAAFRRGILATERDEVWLATPSFSDYTVDKLVDEIKGSMLAKGEYEREDVTRNVANNLGFRRVTDSVRETMKSAFNAAIRRGVLGRKGSVIWREE